MEIALSHNNMDFDSLSAQYALTRLYPTCKMVLAYPLTGNVRSFMSLNRSNLPIIQPKYIDLSKVSRFFLVDCQHFTRLDDACRKLIAPDYEGQGGQPRIIRPVTVFDHHAIDDTGLVPIATSDSLIERVGACTTLLVERIRRQKVELTSFDATVLAIGIFEDTGCLTYSGTTARDADAVSYLIGKGADLAVVREYIRPRMEPEQVQLFEVLLQRAMTMNVDGQRYVLSSFQMPHYVEGLATITRQLMEVETCDGAFTIVRMRDRVHIVGRCDSKALSCRDIVRAFGGDGHPGAASAVVKGGDEAEILAKIVELIRQFSAPQPVAADIMISPVRTIRPDITMDEAGRIMVRYGLDGLVVSDGSELLGIVSRRDIDQSSHHKLGHARVSGFMSKPVIAVEEQTTLNEIQNLMIVEDIGRLPVLDDCGALVGLVSRDDVLKCLFGVNYSRANRLAFEPMTERPGAPSSKRNLSDKLGELDEETVALFKTIGEAAASLNMVAYAVGGMVRDLLLGQPNFDLDFVIEGSAAELAEKLRLDYGGKFELLATHERFQTATLMVHGRVAREIDLSTARTEFYEFPAALPEVEPSKLEQDLLRRDFTINALAVCINPERFGELIDLFDGMRDLEKRVIRILHPFSFIEDPTRIVRAARFAGRLGFHFDVRTREQARRAVSMGIFDDLGGVRIKEELKMILESPHRIKTLSLLSDLGGNLCYLDKKLDFCDSTRRSMRRAERLLERFAVAEPWIVYLGALLSELPAQSVSGVLNRLMLTNKQKENIESGLDLHRQMPLSMKELKRSEVYEMMLGRSRESLAIAAAIAQVGSDLRRALKLYIDELADTKISINGGDLLAMGYLPGPKIGETLSVVLAARLDKEIAGRKEELSLAKRLLGSTSPAGK